MAHLPNLIHDLALILITAGFVTVLFRKIGQPVVLGYIIAGLLVGPHTSIVPTVTDLPNIQIWADIGVIFLLFALGLEFSFKKLFRVGGAASIAAIVEVIGMTLIGYVTGRIFGWSAMDCLFLGGILAISSTTIIIRAIDELGLKQRAFVSLVFGILVVEDLIAILLLVLLSTIALSGSIEGVKLLFPLGKLIFFIVLWFIAGVFILPTLLKSMRRHVTEETLLVVSIGLCFAMVVMTTKAGFSPALGAFFMGSILAETNDAEQIEHLVRPVKDLFAAIFFVSIGMLINPSLLIQYAVPIAILTLLTIAGKFITIMLGALISGRSLRHAVEAGSSLSQIGEFSFIIASLGLSLKVTSEFLYPIAVGVSAITTFTTPYMIRSGERVFHLIEKFLPERVRETLLRYEVSTYRVSARREWKLVLRSYAISALANSVMIIAIFVFLSRQLPAVLSDFVPNGRLAGFLGLLAAALVSAPFFWALLMRRTRGSEIAYLWLNRENRAAVTVLETSRVLYGITLFGVLASQFIAVKFAAAITGVLMFALVVGFAEYLGAIHAWLEARFLRNLKERESVDDASTPRLAPWDAHIARFDVSPSAEVIGQSLEELKVRERFGVTIALIERGGTLLTVPRRNTRLFPGDRISVIGSDEQISLFEELLEPSATASQPQRAANFGLKEIKVIDTMPFCGQSILDSGIRERTDGLVVGLERNGQRILNPDSSMRIEAGDVLWIVGDRTKFDYMIRH